MAQSCYGDGEHISLCEALDRVLNKGVVVHGSVIISVADIDLLYLELRLLLTSVETAMKTGVALRFNKACGFSPIARYSQ